MTTLLSETLDLTDFVEDCGCGYAYEIDVEKSDDGLYSVASHAGCFGTTTVNDLTTLSAESVIRNTVADYEAKISEDEVESFLRRALVQG